MATSAKVVLAINHSDFRTRVQVAGVTVANTVMAESSGSFLSARKALAADVIRNIDHYGGKLAIVCGAFPAVQTAIDGASSGQESYGPTDAQLQSAISTAWNTLAGVG